MYGFFVIEIPLLSSKFEGELYLTRGWFVLTVDEMLQNKILSDCAKRTRSPTENIYISHKSDSMRGWGGRGCDVSVAWDARVWLIEEVLSVQILVLWASRLTGFFCERGQCLIYFVG